MKKQIAELKRCVEQQPSHIRSVGKHVLIEMLRQERDRAAASGDHGEALSINGRIAEVKEMTDEEIRDQIRGSDLYSPTVKRVMESFWRRCDELDAKKKPAR